ncbi:MAG: fibronectin type III domain-containing protein, partial [Naasia sp.]
MRRRRAIWAIAAALVIGSSLGSVLVAPATSASAAAMLDSVAIDRVSDTAISASVTLSSSQNGKWEYRLVARDTSGRYYQSSVTLSSSFGRSATLRLTGLAAGTYDAWVEERVWGDDSTLAIRASTRYTLGFAAPSALSAAVTGEGAARVGWTPPSPAPSSGGYRVRWRASSSPAAAWSAVDVSGSAKTGTDLVGLRPGTTYEITVTTLSGGAEQATSPVTTVVALGAPSAPVADPPVATDGGARWRLEILSTADRPSSTRDVVIESSVAGSGVWAVASATVFDGVWTVTGLVNGTDYELRARAVNAAGASDSVSAAVRPFSVPHAPVLSAIDRSDSAVTVQAAFPSEPGAPADRVDWEIAGPIPAETGFRPATPTAAGSGRWTFDGLTPGGDYTIRVRSANGVGPGEWATSGIVRAITTPSTGSSVVVSPRDGGLHVTALLPATDAAPSDASRAIWQVSSPQTPSWRTVSATPEGDGWLLSGLRNGVDYRVRVGAVNEVGSAEFSAPSEQGRPIGAPLAPMLDDIALTDEAASVVVELRDSPEAPIDGEEWEVATVEAGVTGAWTPATVGRSGSTVRISELMPGQSYALRARTVNVVGSSPWSLVPVFVAEGVPSPVVVSEASALAGSLRVEIDPLVAPGRSCPVDGVVWQIAPAADPGDWSTVLPVADSLDRALIVGLVDGVDYLVRVACENRHGRSAWTVTTALRPIAAPASPSIVSVTVADGHVAIADQVASPASAPVSGLTWQMARVDFVPASSAEPSDGSAPPSSRRLADRVATPAAGWVRRVGEWTTVEPTLVAGRHVIDGLVNGVTYRVRVSAVNTSGSSAWSVTADTTPIAAPADPVFTLSEPSDRALLTALANSGSAARPVSAIAWQVSAESGSQAGRWRTLGAQELGTLRRADGSSVTGGFRLGGLENGVVYRVRVRAVNSAGTSGWVESETGVAPVAGPSTVSTVGDILTGPVSTGRPLTAPRPVGKAIRIESTRASVSLNSGTGAISTPRGPGISTGGSARSGTTTAGATRSESGAGSAEGAGYATETESGLTLQAGAQEVADTAASPAAVPTT